MRVLWGTDVMLLILEGSILSACFSWAQILSALLDSAGFHRRPEAHVGSDLLQGSPVRWLELALTRW